MIIENVPYFGINPSTQIAAGACLAMALAHYDPDLDHAQIQSLYQHAFASREFYAWYISRHNLAEDVRNTVYACMQYIVEEMFPEFECGIVTTSVSKIAFSYPKRRILAIVHGRFPIGASSAPNTVLIRGYVDDYFAVNDPRGNLNSGYADRFGANQLYTADDIKRYCGDERGEITIFRLSRITSTL